MRYIEKQAKKVDRAWTKFLKSVKKENPVAYDLILEIARMKGDKMKEKHYFTKEMKKDFKLWLLEQDYTQQDFASLCGVSVAYINNIVCGQRNITDSIREIFRKGGYEICDK